MTKYKANRNKNEKIDEVEEKSEQQQKKESTAKALDVGLTLGLDAYTGGQFSKIKNGISKIPGIGRMAQNNWDKKINNISNIASKTPLGDIAQGLDKTGVTDTVKSATNMKNGSGSLPNKTNNIFAQKSNPLSFLNKTNFKGTSKTSVNGFADMILKKYKTKIILIGGLTLFFVLVIIVILGGKDFQNLALTNNTVMASSGIVANSVTREEVQSKLLYVGDSRVVGMSNAISDGINSIGEVGMGYDWFISDGMSQLESKINENPDKAVVLALGVNDLGNIDNYINTYKSLMEKYPNTKFYIMSVNPVDETKTVNNGYTVTNGDINAFNQKMQEAFPDNYIDTNSNISFSTDDGVHYNNDTYVNINEYVVNNIMQDYNVMGDAGSIDQITTAHFLGGTAKKLEIGNSILSVLGQEKIDSWNNQIKLDVSNAGIGTGAAPAIAAYDLIMGALNEGIIVPYLYGGGHGAISVGIDGSWGSSATVGSSGTALQPSGSTQANGLDCSGFVSWALKNGGCSSFTVITSGGFVNLGSKIDPNSAKTGDIAANSSHVSIILKNTGSSLIVAEAKGAKYGIVFNEYNYSSFNNYTVVDMYNYYTNNCKG